jgi:hypothetical protein
MRLDVLARTRFIVSPQSDRWGTGCRGSIPRLADREMILGRGSSLEASQVPASGEPILLMADRQTTGGYPQLAVVIHGDIPLAAQLATGDWIEFHVCSRSERFQHSSHRKPGSLPSTDRLPARLERTAGTADDAGDWRGGAMAGAARRTADDVDRAHRWSQSMACRSLCSAAAATW